jgi:hypothetical protein
MKLLTILISVLILAGVVFAQEARLSDEDRLPIEEELRKINLTLVNLTERVQVLETQGTDHEARITALEP